MTRYFSDHQPCPRCDGCISRGAIAERADGCGCVEAWMWCDYCDAIYYGVYDVSAGAPRYLWGEIYASGEPDYHRTLAELRDVLRLAKHLDQIPQRDRPLPRVAPAMCVAEAKDA